MRLDREVGSLNRDIIAIKEKWKIALNIDAKKVAIEKLITKRKRLRDSQKVSQTIQDATKEEMEYLKNPTIKKTISQATSSEVEKTSENLKTKPQKEKLISSKERVENPEHLTVNWLKNRLRNRKK